jgi:hypothetical protein
MTVAVSCILSGGAVLAVDSAFTVTMGTMNKVYDSAEKLFTLGERPVGVAFYGAGEFGGRIIGSYIAEFCAKQPRIVAGQGDIASVAEELRAFFYSAYMKVVVPTLENSKGKPFGDIPEGERPGLGLVIAGFSPKAYLAEAWNVLIPVHSTAGSAARLRAPGEFGANWFALHEPITRYFLGADQALAEPIAAYIDSIRQPPLADDEKLALQKLLRSREYQFPVGMMPMPVAADFARFLIELTIAHHRFEMAASGVGGRARVGSVTYRGEPFRIHGEGVSP